MKYILSIAIILTALSCQGAPYLVSNEQTTATRYEITGGPAWLPSSVNGTAIRIDLANYQQGTWAIKAKACNDIWCGPEDDYTLTCPAPLTAPVLKIEP